MVFLAKARNGDAAGGASLERLHIGKRRAFLENLITRCEKLI